MKLFDNTVIVTDLDGTLLTDSKRPGERNLAAIEYFKQNGGHFAIATGRVAALAEDSIPELPKLVNMLSVTSNGSLLYDFRTGEAPFVHTMDYELIKEIVDFVHAEFPSAGMRASTVEYAYVCTPEDKDNVRIKKDFESHPGVKTCVAELERWREMTLLKVVTRLPEQELPSAVIALREHFKDRVEVAPSWSTIIDIQPAGISKGAIFSKYVKDTMGDGARIYACGDYLNDIELLSIADVAVCPSNAHDDVKRICELCLCSNNDGLIAELVDHIERELGK